jgi:hypothetical protein
MQMPEPVVLKEVPRYNLCFLLFFALSPETMVGKAHPSCLWAGVAVKATKCGRTPPGRRFSSFTLRCEEDEGGQLEEYQHHRAG